MFDLNDFDAFSLSLKAATLHDQWQARVAKVGGKMFMALGLGGLWQGHLIFKTTNMSYPILLEQNGIVCAPYMKKGGWVALNENANLTDDDLKNYLTQSYQLICSKLTRNMRSELGIKI